MSEEMRVFELFCKEYNLEYNFMKLGNQYAAIETQKSFIVFKYAVELND